jgi:hypothetical protein
MDVPGVSAAGRRNALMRGHARGDYVARDRDKKLRRIFLDGKEEAIADFRSEPETFAYGYIFGEQEEKRFPCDESFAELGKAIMAGLNRLHVGCSFFHSVTTQPIKAGIG